MAGQGQATHGGTQVTSSLTLTELIRWHLAGQPEPQPSPTTTSTPDLGQGTRGRTIPTMDPLERELRQALGIHQGPR